MNASLRKIPWGMCVVLAIGVGLVLLGAVRFYRGGNFGLREALYCALALIPAGLLLLVIAYVVQHAKLVAVIPLMFAVVLIHASPVFDVAIGIMLMGVMLEPYVSEWRRARHVPNA
jgi:hypothetical protein